MSPVLKVIAWVIGIPAGGFFLLFLYFLFNPDNTPTVEKIAAECQREYGSRGREAVDDCRLKIMTRYLLEHERRKEQSTFDRVR